MQEPEQRPEASENTIDVSRTGILLCDAAGRVLRANVALHELLGRAPGSITGGTLQEAAPGASNMLSALLDVMKKHESVRCQAHIPDAQGELRPYDILAVRDTSGKAETVQFMMTPALQKGAASLKDSGLVENLQRWAEQYSEVQSIVHREKWLSAMCSEMHIAAEAVTAYFELLAADVQTPVASLSAIRAHVKRLARSIEDVATVIASGPDAWQVKPQPVDLEDAVESAAAAVYPDALRKQLGLAINVSEGAEVVNADPPLLRRLLTVLLAHAVRVTPALGNVVVSAGEVKGSVVISVSDGGAAVEESEITGTFDPFTEILPLAPHHSGSSAYGLALAWRLVQAHRGQAWVEHPEEIGNVFFFSLPQ